MDTGASENVLTGVASVTIRGASITVKELTWRQHVRAVKDTTGVILKLIGDGQKKGAVELTTEKVVDAISQQVEVVSWILVESTGKDQAWVDALGARDMMTILKAVVDLNLSPEVIDLGKTLAVRMGDVFGLKTASLAPSISSSPKDTALRT